MIWNYLSRALLSFSNEFFSHVDFQVTDFTHGFSVEQNHTNKNKPK